MTSHALEYVAEGLSLLSVVLIWIPAYKVTRSLRLAQSMQATAKEDKGDLGVLAEKLKTDIERSLSAFNRADYYMLLGGFALAVVSSLIKLIWVIGAS